MKYIEKLFQYFDNSVNQTPFYVIWLGVIKHLFVLRVTKKEGGRADEDVISAQL